MDFLRNAWKWLSISKNQKTLAFIGAGISPVILGLWVAFQYFESKDKKSTTQPTFKCDSNTISSNNGGTAVGCINNYGMNPEEIAGVAYDLFKKFKLDNDSIYRQSKPLIVSITTLSQGIGNLGSKKQIDEAIAGLKQGDLSKAKDIFQKKADRWDLDSNKRAEAYQNVGVFALLDNSQEAVKSFKEAVQLDPTNYKHKNNLEYARKRLKEPTNATFPIPSSNPTEYPTSITLPIKTIDIPTKTDGIKLPKHPEEYTSDLHFSIKRDYVSIACINNLNKTYFPPEYLKKLIECIESSKSEIEIVNFFNETLRYGNFIYYISNYYNNINLTILNYFYSMGILSLLPYRSGLVCVMRDREIYNCSSGLPTLKIDLPPELLGSILIAFLPYKNSLITAFKLEKKDIVIVSENIESIEDLRNIRYHANDGLNIISMELYQNAKEVGVKTKLSDGTGYCSPDGIHLLGGGNTTICQ